jgi:hypothetical protein
MAPISRSVGRNIHVYDAADRTTVLGGLILTKGITNANFYSMVEILVLFTTGFELLNENNVKIERNDNLLLPGRFYINPSGKYLHLFLFSLLAVLIPL